MLVFWLKSTDFSVASETLQSSVLLCKQRIESGFYHGDTRLFVVTETDEATAAVLAEKEIRRHPLVIMAVIMAVLVMSH